MSKVSNTLFSKMSLTYITQLHTDATNEQTDHALLVKGGAQLFLLHQGCGGMLMIHLGTCPAREECCTGSN